MKIWDIMTQEEAALLNSTNLIKTMDFMLEMSAQDIHMMDLGLEDANYNIIEDHMIMGDSSEIGRTYQYATEPAIYINFRPKDSNNSRLVCYMNTGNKDNRYRLDNYIIYDECRGDFHIIVEEESLHYVLKYISTDNNISTAKVNINDEAEVFQYSVVGGVPLYLFDIAKNMRKLLHKSHNVNKLTLKCNFLKFDLGIRDLGAEYVARTSV